MAVALVLLLAPAPAGAESFKVLTYNVQGLPGIAMPDNKYGRTNHSRGHEIAKRVAGAGYDVVAFNEVFADDMREGLLGPLTPSDYPTRVLQLDDGNIGNQDSGLMLFSRFTSLPMTNVAPDECVKVGPSGCMVAFHVYDACSDAGSSGMFGIGDCASDKGIGLVRLNNPATGRPLDVLFTHMQADYGMPQTITARSNQFGEVRSFIERWLPKGSAAGRDALFMGDLNVIGGSGQWKTEIGTNSSLDNDFGFRELWRYEHSPKDRGFTYDPRNSQHGVSAGKKLDYILLRRATGQTCAHHQRLPYRLLRDSERADLSDHWPLEATIGSRLSGNCSPHRAVAVTKSTMKSGMAADPGGSLWYRIDKAGTWSALSSHPATTVQAYAEHDLSSPLENLVPVPGSRRKTFHVDERPVYVRVSMNSPSAKPQVSVLFQRRVGTTRASAMHLPTAVRQVTSFGFDFQDPKGSENKTERYWRIRSRALTSGGRQDIRIAANGFGGDSLRLRLRLLSVKGTQLATTGAFQPKPVLKTKLPAKAGDFIVELSRINGSEIGNVELEYTTNLRSVRLLRVRCNEQNEPAGDDHIRMRIKSDLQAFKVFEFMFDTNQARSLRTRYGDDGLVNFISRVDMRLIEVDPGPDDDLGSVTIFNAETNPVFLKKFTGDGSDYDLFVEDVPLP